jgi:hypothetical protein
MPADSAACTRTGGWAGWICAAPAGRSRRLTPPQAASARQAVTPFVHDRCDVSAQAYQAACPGQRTRASTLRQGRCERDAKHWSAFADIPAALFR